MDPSQLTQILINATSSDQSLRSMSEKILGEADKQNPGLFFTSFVCRISK